MRFITLLWKQYIISLCDFVSPRFIRTQGFYTKSSYGTFSPFPRDSVTVDETSLESVPQSESCVFPRGTGETWIVLSTISFRIGTKEYIRIVQWSACCSVCCSGYTRLHHPINRGIGIRAQPTESEVAAQFSEFGSAE